MQMQAIMEKVQQQKLGLEVPQQIIEVGEPDNLIEVRFEKGDTEVLFTCTEEGSAVRIWLSKGDVEELKKALEAALRFVVD